MRDSTARTTITQKGPVEHPARHGHADQRRQQGEGRQQPVAGRLRVQRPGQHPGRDVDHDQHRNDERKGPPQRLADRSVLIDVEYFRVERVPVEGSRTSASLRGGEKPGLAYLFAAAGSGRLTGARFEPVELPARGIVAVPAASPDFVLGDVGGADEKLDLIRITPNWPN